MNTRNGRGFVRSFAITLCRVAVGCLGLALCLGAGTAGAQTTNGTVVGWNNLGMHCMDADFSVFCILPPYNVIMGQAINSSGMLVGGDAGSTITYQAVADPSGSINTTSVGKNNFWSYDGALFGITLPPDVGLPVPGPNSFAMPGVKNTPQSMAYDTNLEWFAAYGIPLTPYDDAGQTNRYSMMRLVAKNGATLAAHKDIVLPVADEMNCKACHASGSGPAAQPAEGWVNLADQQRDFRLNILRMHDDRQLGTPTFTAALVAGGYPSAGLYASVVTDNKPVLCASCHHSEALPGSGQTGVPPLTESMHTHHGSVVDPVNGMLLDTEANRTSCYYCHPGQLTKCLRGVMGTSVAADGSLAIECQSCHGGMNVVGAATRTGWLNEPNCQACHSGDAVSNGGQIRYLNVFQATNMMRVSSNTRFATSPDVPAAGYSLYRFSRGHGNLYCEACHNSTHAEFPSADTNDNVACIQQQGHIGVLAECESCHVTTPSTVTGGPHGLHPLGQTWVSRHEDNAGAACQVCHGTDYRGTVLSRSRADRTISALGTKTFWRGFQIGCYTCHNGPGGDGTGPAPAAVTSRTIATSVGTSVAIPLTATGTGTLTLRVVSQPAHGRVGMSGTVATYFPDAGFAGTDTFTFSAWNGSCDSNLGDVTITVGQGTPCTYTIAPANATVAAGAGSGTVTVTAGSGCAWTAVSGASWVTIAGGASGAGPGTVTYSYTANPGSASRSGTLTIGGNTFTLSQAGLACTYTLTPTGSSVGGAAGTGSVAVNTSANCAWTASSGASWLTITSGVSGMGPGTVAYSIAANVGAARAGTLTVAGLTYTVNQAATPCSYAITPASAAVGAGAGSGSVAVNTTATCPWGAASNVPWLTITSGAAGVGPGTVTYMIAANTATGSRTGTLTIGGQTFTVSQAGVTCTYAITPTGVSLGAHATNGTVAITTGSGCAWTASSTVPWIAITAGMNGTGDGTVRYSVTANTSGLVRHGTLSIAGLTFVVSQASSGGGCTYLLTPTSAQVPARVSTNTFRVTTGGGCDWTAQSTVGWVTVLPRAGGTGSGTVRFRVSANLSSQPRNGTISVGGQTFTVYQAGSPREEEGAFGEVSVSGMAGHQRITAEFILQNNGETSKVKLHPAVYLSDSTSLDSGAVLLWGRTVPALAPGESVVGKFRLTVPGGVNTHGKYLLADVSAGGPLKVASAPVVVYGPLP